MRGKTLADAQLQAYGYREVGGKVVRIAPLAETRAAVLPGRHRQQPEEDQQVALFQWRDQVGVLAEPLLGLLYHTPNGKQRSQAAAGRLKAMGTTRGVFDLFLPVARRGFHGYYLELKTPGRSLSPEQRTWNDLMIREGYLTSTHTTWHEAAQQLCWYLGRLDMAQALGGQP
jgi:hypothetical protein